MEWTLEKIREFFENIFETIDWEFFFENVIMDPLFKWFIVLIIILLVMRYRRLKRANCVRVCITDRGPVFMKKSALKGIVKKICHGAIPQSKSRVKVCSCGRKINLRVSVASPHNMQSISTQLQQTISRILREEIGISNLGHINVVIEKIIGPVKVSPLQKNFCCLKEEEENKIG